MRGSRDPRLLRRLAAMLVGGPNADQVRTDLDEAYRRDLGRGVSRRRAYWRYLSNAVASSFFIARSSRLSISWLDVKLGSRMLRKYPGLTAVSVFALAIGIPVGIAPSWLADAVESPLPHPEGERLRALRYWDLGETAPESATWYDYTQWREALTAFESLGALKLSGYNVAFNDATGPPVAGAEVTASTFDVLRTRALHGRVLFEADEEIGGPAVVVLGHALWRARFAGDPGVVGREIRLSGVPHTVVGVMPETFRFPVSHQLWVPLRERPASGPIERQSVRVIGRLADGVSAEDAQAQLTAFGRQMAAVHPEAYERLQPEVVKPVMLFAALPRGGVRALPAYYIVQALSLVLLVVACINVALLIFARTATRSSELAVRTALGASRARIISQVFTECLVLAVVAAGFGLLLLGALPRLLPAEIATRLPYWFDFGVSAKTVLLALLLASFSAVVAGMVPALKVTGRAVQHNIQQSRANRSGIQFGGTSSALVALDVAVAVGVISFAVSVVDSLGRAWTEQAESVGFPAGEYLSAELFLPNSEPSTPRRDSDEQAFIQRFGAVQQALVARLEAEPRVRLVAVADNLPRMEHPTVWLDVEGDDAASGEDVVRRAKLARVDIGFFNALHVPVLAGRAFETSDLGETVSVALVNESFVQTVLQGRNPIGQRVRYRPWGGETTGWYQIVGVVGRAGIDIMQPEMDAGLYLPLTPGTVHPIRLAIHTGDDPESFIPRLREIAAEVDPNTVIGSPLALNRVFEGDWYLAATATFGGLVGVAILLALAACGVYALMSFAVAERTREIGIRTALGARSDQIAWTVAKRSLMQIGIGAALGTPIAWRAFSWFGEDSTGILTRLAASLLPGLAVTLVIGVVACTAPVLRALRVTPTEVLRE